ncbi:hypothetical protein EF847_16525 [Actinobacteria bacterium YIM 96077]|uniref:Uncharacterized protein n=1 Tax=Phytoactinopolyspora halophila TaxID=1981511 RepID=A0A329QG82_9ACTN|nr:hypothetical protein [Phytoactinopolyspora halophila]AYY14064.1 hypothetical protein EF847_16525 [Actinobacteria bacterium YIM 96077]RAW10971.1 hypothetical protein DPM12_17860 [Phytoactinopolyspora halophila]
MQAPSGVVFPRSAGDTRSTSAFGRAVVADALRGADPVGARAAEHEANWRANYLVHFRRLVEAGLTSADAARQIAADGLASLHERMRVVTGDEETSLAAALDHSAEPLETAVVSGEGTPERELVLPYRGQRLQGDDLARQLDTWVRSGVIEPSCAEAIRTVMANPDWLDLSDLQIVIFGAGAEMGPVRSLLRWGGDVTAVDLPRPGIWNGLIETARRYAGRLHLPVRTGDGKLEDRAGADLLHELPALAGWLSRLDGPLVLGNYAYADGATHVRVAMAVDALTDRLARERGEATLSFLATPTDVFAVPADAVEHSVHAYEKRSKLSMIRRPLKIVSGGRMLQRNYAPGADPGICDSLVPQQGPNYALAKRLQRWRATTAHAHGATVSLNVAPPTRTRSVTKNRALSAVYAGAHRFGVEVFEPGTANTLMAALLVHDLRRPAQPREHPWLDEAAQAAHGGLWRIAYAPRSALGLAGIVGLTGART